MNTQPTFREWCKANGREWPRFPNYGIGQDPDAYYCPKRPIFTPTAKRAGDLVLGAGGKWSVMA